MSAMLIESHHSGEKGSQHNYVHMYKCTHVPIELDYIDWKQKNLLKSNKNCFVDFKNVFYG